MEAVIFSSHQHGLSRSVFYLVTSVLLDTWKVWLFPASRWSEERLSQVWLPTIPTPPYPVCALHQKGLKVESLWGSLRYPLHQCLPGDVVGIHSRVCWPSLPLRLHTFSVGVQWDNSFLLSFRNAEVFALNSAVSFTFETPKSRIDFFFFSAFVLCHLFPEALSVGCRVSAWGERGG